MLWTLFVAFVLLRIVMRFNGALRSGRAGGCILVLGSILLLLAGILIWAQYIGNKGPNDVGAALHGWHVENSLSEKYGPMQKGSQFTPVGFESDNNNTGSGTYRSKFNYDGHTGTILCHYDKTTGKFDHDQIVPDK